MGSFDRASFYYPSCTSTLDMVQPYIEKGRIAEGSVWVTDYQSQGKGQRGNRWLSLPEKNLLFTLVLYPEWLAIEQIFSLNIIISLAIYEVLYTRLPKGTAIKWPNDIYYLDKKLGGILIDTVIRKGKIDHVTISSGLNVNQLTFKWPNATSLYMNTNTIWDRSLLLNQIMTMLGKYYLQLKDGMVDILWKSYMDKLYRKRGWHMFKTQQGCLKGRIVEVNKHGQLMIATTQGSYHLYNPKEIVFA